MSKETPSRCSLQFRRWVGPAVVAAWFALVLRPMAAQDGSNRPEATGPVSGLAQRRILLSGRYLNLPVKTGAPLRTIDVVVAGKVVREIPIEFAAGEPDFWAFCDVSPWRGQAATLQASGAAELSRIEAADSIEESGNLYAEALRPQFHFSTRRGWINDPNGLVYYAGEYHLFYQHNPYGWNGADKHWGHAVSRDMVHWEELPIALYPDELGMIYSGSAVVDWRNSAQFQTGSEKAIVLIYTGARYPRTQCLAYSNDRGRTWTKFAANPVLPNVTPSNRDPKVIWHQPTQSWIMALYVGHPGSGLTHRNPEANDLNTIEFFSSPDLKRWKFLSRIEGFYECPDFFPLTLQGKPGIQKWILQAANSNYMVGRFDGRVFQPETPILTGHRGDALYAPQTFSDMPDGRRVQIGWGRIAMPGMPFNQMMLFPCELTLGSTPEGPRLHWRPVPEIESLYTRRRSLAPQALRPGDNPLKNLSGEQFDIKADLAVGVAAEVGFIVRGVPIVYDAGRRRLTCQKSAVSWPLEDGGIKLRILVDRVSLEIFGQDGLIYMPIGMHPLESDRSLAVFARNGEAAIRSLEVAELASIWPPPSGRLKH